MRTYALIVVKDGKERIVDEPGNIESQMIQERNWETRGWRGPLRGCDLTEEEWKVIRGF